MGGITKIWQIKYALACLAIIALIEWRVSANRQKALYDKKEQEQISLINEQTDLIKAQSKIYRLSTAAYAAGASSSAQDDGDKDTEKLDAKIRDDDARIKVLQDWMDEHPR